MWQTIINDELIITFRLLFYYKYIFSFWHCDYDAWLGLFACSSAFLLFLSFSVRLFTVVQEVTVRVEIFTIIFDIICKLLLLLFWLGLTRLLYSCSLPQTVYFSLIFLFIAVITHRLLRQKLHRFEFNRNKRVKQRERHVLNLHCSYKLDLYIKNM